MSNFKNKRIDAGRAIEGIKAGDKQIFEEVYRDYRNDFIHWAGLRFPFDKEELCDAFQDAVIVFYEKVKSGQIQSLDCALATFLYAIGFNCLCALSRKKKRTQLEAPDEIQALSAKTQADAQLAEDEWDIERAVLLQAVNQLSNTCREILIMAIYEELSNEEIMQRMGYLKKDIVAVSKSKCLKTLVHLIKNG